MGCDIHSFAEVKKNENWEVVLNHFSMDEINQNIYNCKKSSEPFNVRSYSIFAFLADVRNYALCKPISDIKGFPDDASKEVKHEYEEWLGDVHSASYLSLGELLDFNYEEEFFNNRMNETMSYHDFLGEPYFKVIEELKQLGNNDNVRVVFFFDN